MKPDLLISVDPGLRAMGAAFFFRGQLAGAALIRNPIRKKDALGKKIPKEFTGSLPDHMQAVECFRAWAGDRYFPDYHLAIEIPQAYRADRQKGDQNDIVSLAVIAGAVCSYFPAAKLARYYPREWKGQVDPETSNRRVLEELSPAEMVFVEQAESVNQKAKSLIGEVPESLKHNMIDAIGVGLKHLGRFEPRRVYPL